MQYFKLQIKRILKSKFTWISLILILSICAYFLRINYIVNNVDSHDLSQAKSNLIIQQHNIKYFGKALKDSKLGTQEKKQMTGDLKEAKSTSKELQTLIGALKNNDWKTAYPIMIRQEKRNLASAKKDNLDNALLAMSKRDLRQLEILAKLQIPKENYASIKGGFFVLQMMETTIPPLVVLAVVFILVKIYSAGFFERMRLSNLLPQKKLTLTEFYTGTTIGFSYFLLIFFLIFLLPSIFFGTGNFNYPITAMNPQAKEYIFIPMFRLFLPTLFLELLSFAFITAVVLLIIQLFKRRLVALLLSVFLLVGGMVLPQFVIGVLLQANVPEENELHPKRGFLFIFKLLEGLLPILATVMLCFILSNLFTAKYAYRLNRATLLPNNETTTIDLMTGLLVTFVLILIVSSVAFGISSLLFGSGSLSYPVQAFALPKEAPQYLPLAAWLVPTIGLMVLAFIFMVVLIQFIAQVSCNQLSCLFISLVLLLGGAVLPLLMQSVEKQAQFSFVRYLPTTYILAFQVVTGRFGLALRDLHLNFASGCQVLVIAIVALAVLNLLWPKIAQQVGQYFSK